MVVQNCDYTLNHSFDNHVENKVALKNFTFKIFINNTQGYLSLRTCYISFFATALVKECGEVIREGSKARYTYKNDVLGKDGNPNDLVTETDKKVEEIVQSKLLANYLTHK